MELFKKFKGVVISAFREVIKPQHRAFNTFSRVVFLELVFLDVQGDTIKIKDPAAIVDIDTHAIHFNRHAGSMTEDTHQVNAFENIFMTHVGVGERRLLHMSVQFPLKSNNSSNSLIFSNMSLNSSIGRELL